MAEHSISDAGRKAAAEVKTGGAAKLHGVADALRGAADHLEKDGSGLAARYAGETAQRIDRWAERMEAASLRDMVADVERFARNRPEVFLGGAFAVGFLAARFLKSSHERISAASMDTSADTAGVWPAASVPSPRRSPVDPLLTDPVPTAAASFDPDPERREVHP